VHHSPARKIPINNDAEFPCKILPAQGPISACLNMQVLGKENKLRWWIQMMPENKVPYGVQEFG
jgi:hypothetical protein